MTSPIDHKSLVKKSLNPGRALAAGFFVLIMIGGCLLALPVSAADGRSLGLLTGMFTATSAVCVTGLTVIDPGSQLSLFGQIVLLTLIQAGGLGFMALATLGLVLLGKRISLRNRMLISESMNQNGLSGMVRLTLWFFLMAIVIELAGAAILAAQFIPVFGVAKGIWFGFFHSVSAFCNAGFDLLGDGLSLLSFNQDSTVLMTLAGLIIIGGLGFAVLLEFAQHRRTMSKLSLHAKLVLTMTGLLLVGGTLCVLVLEWGNPHTLGSEGFTIWDRLVNSFFQATTFRTAGFAAMDQAQLNDTTKLLGCLLMFIGASSASTGGGVKTTTFAAVILLVITVVRGRERITVFGREIAATTARRAIAIITIALGVIVVAACVLSTVERSAGIPMLDLFFEATSAITTTGLSTIGTGRLCAASQILLMLLMFFGRVGPLTIAMALANRLNGNMANRVHHPEGKIMIG